MIKGINHQIIEVNQTNNPYFERAILIVRSEIQDKKYRDLAKISVDYINGIKGYSGLKKQKPTKRNNLKYLVFSMAFMFLGVFVGLLIK